MVFPLKSYGEDINSFIYQLQDVKHKTLSNTSFDIGVIDIDDANFSPSEVLELKNQNKSIVSYLSIGEAENYRDYWIEGNFDNNPPSFIDERNPDFPDNYKVEFWDPEWQQIVFNRLDEIITAGYDGVYLDIIDAYFYYEEKGRTSARKEMEDFVIEIARRGRERKPGFLIIPQNSPELVNDSEYLNVIDGLGKEDTFFFDNRKVKKRTVNRDLRFLKKITDEGKFVLAIDYPTKKSKQCKFIELARKNHFAPFVSNRNLDKIELPTCNE
jgi:cysteinyl-tRNA synthetase